MRGRGVLLRAFWVKLDLDLNTRSVFLFRLGMGSKYSYIRRWVDLTVDHICVHFVLRVIPSDVAITSVRHICIGRKTWVQQNDAYVIRNGSCERLGHCVCTWRTVPCGVFVYLRVGWR